MGIRRALRIVREAESIHGLPVDLPGRPRRVGMSTPWGQSDLHTIVYADIFGLDTLPVTRAEAIQLPTVARARDILATTIGRTPMRAYRGDVEVDPQPTFLYRTDGGLQTPFHRMVWTVDDLIFGGWSLWALERGVEGDVIDAARVPPGEWTFGDDGQVLYLGQSVDDLSVILIPGPHEGVLTRGSRTIRAARNLEEVVASRARNPTPVTEIHVTSDDELFYTEDGLTDEGKALRDEYARARQSVDGSVTVTPSNVDLRFHGDVSVDLLIQGRNAAAIDLARHVGTPGAVVDASNVNSTLTYETVAGRNAELLDYGFEPYMSAVESRLSMDDVVPRGQRVAFDTTELRTVNPDPAAGPTEED